MRPPSCSKYLLRALAIDCEPPRGIGQPTTCPAPPRTNAKADDIGALSGRKEWAAIPAIRARVGSLLKKMRASTVVGQRAMEPKRARLNGCRGKWRIGCKNSGTRFGQCCAIGLIKNR